MPRIGIKIEKAEDIFFWSSMIELLAFVVVSLLDSSFPNVEATTAQKILEALIPLDGVVFGFSGVMVGLFLRNFHKLSEKTLKGCFMFTALSFWSYIFSILFSFLYIALGQERVTYSVFTPVLLTIFGLLCSSILLLMIFAEEIYPSKEKP